MKLTINSKNHGQITFSRPGTYYIYADLNGKSGTLGKQICNGGETSGSTISYSGDDQVKFEEVCRRWYRAYSRKCAVEA